MIDDSQVEVISFVRATENICISVIKNISDTWSVLDICLSVDCY